jgi:hypothetical protein
VLVSEQAFAMGTAELRSVPSLNQATGADPSHNATWSRASSWTWCHATRWSGHEASSQARTPRDRADRLVLPAGQGGLEEDLRVDATFEDLAAMVARPVKTRYVKRPFVLEACRRERYGHRC